jgi:hypothetical protein
MAPALTAWVHPSCQPYDPLQSGSFEMFAVRHWMANLSEQLKVLLLPGKQSVRLEVGDDLLEEDREAANLPLQRLVASVRPDGPLPKYS